MLLTCFPLNSCSKPEKGIDTDEILAMLLSIPPIPTPPETEENAQNQGFLLTLGHCKDVERYRYYAFDKRVQILLDSSDVVTTTVKEDTIWWVLISQDGVSTYTLRVIVGDTLRFRMEWSGPAHQGGASSWHEGWIVPAMSIGHITTEVGIPDIRWRMDDEYSAVSCLFLRSYVLVDSIYGGGYLFVSEMMTVVFEAHWDAFGHGRIVGSYNW